MKYQKYLFFYVSKYLKLNTMLKFMTRYNTIIKMKGKTYKATTVYKKKTKLVSCPETTLFKLKY